MLFILDRVFTRLNAGRQEGSHTKIVLKKLEEIDTGELVCHVTKRESFLIIITRPRST